MEVLPVLGQDDLPVLSIADYGAVLNKLERAWEQFIANGSPCPHLPRSPILESWQRSKQRGVPFNLQKAPLKLDDDQILAEKERRWGLFEVMSPYLEDIVKTFPGDNIAVTFSNEKGIILDCRYGRYGKKLLDRFQKDNYIPGADWSERAFGTNGIGAALENGKPVKVFAAEHYCKVAHDMICLSAPVRETVSGGILGVLTITGQRHIIPAHNLNWVIVEAQKIEKAIQGRLQEEASNLFNLLFEKANQPGIIYNLSGEISRMNKLAQNMFYAKPGDRLDDIFDYFAKQSPFLHQFNQTFASTCRRTGQRFIVTAMPWAIGEYLIGGIAFFHHERSGAKPVHHAAMSPGTRYVFSSIISQNPSFRKMVQLAEKASCVDSTILITGETGTGKEVLAQSIHNNSRRKEQVFYSVNCGAMPKELIAAELFGYEGGAFTGAQKGGKTGKFEAANGGTLFLDEIGDMPLELQVYLLRVLEEGLITRIGSHKTVPVDVRVICATNKDLQQEMELGRFRRDLYYRINSIEIFLPPLRDRREDIPLLAKHFLQCFNNNCRLSPDAVEKLSEYSWPGNVRELKNIIERAAFLCDGAIITANDLCLPEKKQVIRSYSAKPVSATPVQELCPEIISQVLRECRGNMSLAARRLQISRMTLYRKIKKYGLNLS